MEHIAITTLGADQETIVQELFGVLATPQCNVRESRMVMLGNERAVSMLVSGNWGSIAKIEAHLMGLQKRVNGILYVKRTSLLQLQDNLLPYLVQVVSLDMPGVIYEICNFFSFQSININDLQSNPFQAPYSGTGMIMVTMSISIPVDVNLADLRERFMMLCDELNIDGIMEPEKR